MAKSKARRQERPRGWKGLPKTVKLWIAFALVCSTAAGILAQWPRWFPVAPERQVAIYRTHGCKCALAWARQLEASGYLVTMYEPETLKTIRGALKTPPLLRGCHVARYLEYFVEGHVAPVALAELARTHPRGIGIAQETDVRKHSTGTTVETAEKPPMVIYEDNGMSRSWRTADGT